MTSHANGISVSAAKKARQRAKDGRLAFEGGETGTALCRGDSLTVLYGRSAISPAQYQAGLLVRALWIARGGAVRSIDLTAVRVDGGRPAAEAIRLGALAADEELRRLVKRARLGLRTATVLIRICGEGESLTAVAVSLEEDAAARDAGGCTKGMLGHVRAVLKEALADVAVAMTGDVARGHPFHNDRVFQWTEREVADAVA